MPAPEFDAGTLGLESQGRALTPSERMGINPAAGALSRAAAVAVDSGATPVQFLGATGRDLQARATGPGVTNESNVIDVQAGDSLIFPATTKQIKTEGKMKLIETYV